jgi:hypothetical protein
MNNSEINQEISQEELKILDEISSNKSNAFESEVAQESAYAVAVAGLTSQTRAKFAGMAQTESAQADVEALVAVQEGIADTVKNFILRLVGPLKEQIKNLAARGRDVLCPWLQSRICGSLGWFAKTACNWAFPAVCRALFSWIVRVVGA